MKKFTLAIVFIIAFSVSAFSEGEKKPPKRDYVPYCGMRVTTEQQDFMVTMLSAQKSFNGENSLMEITVRFSMPIDPRSVNAGTVLLNEEKCGSNVFFHFGRRGESVRISILNPKEESIDIKFTELISYKGDKLLGCEFENIQDGTEITRGR